MKRKGITFDTIREIALALPDVEESTSYGTPAFKRKKKLMIRLKEDGQTIVLILGFDHREMLMQARPDAFFITDHYRNYPTVLMRMAAVTKAEARDVIGMAWREVAPKGRRAKE